MARGSLLNSAAVNQGNALAELYLVLYLSILSENCLPDLSGMAGIYRVRSSLIHGGER